MVAALVAALAMTTTTACSSTDAASADPTTAVATIPSASAPSSAAPSTASVSSTVVDRLPAAARPATSDGARAFVDFYIESINTAFERPSAAAIRGLATATCTICAALTARAEQFENTGQHYAGPIYRPGGSTASADGPGQKVVVDIEQFGVATFDRDGRQIDLNTASRARFAVSLEFTNAWQVTRWAEIPSSTA